MVAQLSSIYERFVHLEEQLSNPEIVSDMTKFTKLNKEYRDLEPLVEAYKKHQNLTANIANAKEMLSDEDDDMRKMAKEELSELVPELENLEEEIKIMLIPKDPDDSKDVIFEIRSGTGGDEASIFAGDLFRMYTRYFEDQRWKTDLLFVNEGSSGGYSKIIIEVVGENVYGKLKFESGAHRVQRIPKTESQGRVHTSAATVAVMPKFEEEDINIRKEDLRIDVFRASGAGGQHVNRTESAVRITHLPTGFVTECQEGRSQHQNKEIAMQRLYQNLKDAQKLQNQNEQAAQRRSLVGTGDRSDKIRTYNYPQNRVTDHRINLTLYNLDQIMEGDINGIIESLQVAENAEKMKAREAEEIG
ncbi:MAG: peptide chain release factor 1 [Saprospiraceae bacterium]|nr:peptide chain release factor 1 [Saprospiraceae bacterium]